MPAPAAHLHDIVQASSIRYNNTVYELTARGVDVIVLSLGEAFFDLPPVDFRDLPYPASHHYSHSRGIPALRGRLAAYYAEHGVRVDPDSELIVTAGSKIAIHMALMTILDPGDEVLVPEPAWVSYSEQVRLCHGVPVMVPHHRTVAELGDDVTPRTKAIIVNNPNNPAGRVLTRPELELLHALAAEHDLFLLADEAYSDFAPDDAFLSCATLDPGKRHTIVCNSLSKGFGLSGWRVGYTIAARSLVDQMLKLNQHLVTCAPTILQHWLARHFDEIRAVTRPQIAALLERRRAIARLMAVRGMSHLPGDATFYFFVSLARSALSSDEFCMRLLRERHVSTVPGIGYGPSCDRFLRLSIGTEPLERIATGIQMIDTLLAETAVPALVVAGTPAQD